MQLPVTVAPCLGLLAKKWQACCSSSLSCPEATCDFALQEEFRELVEVDGRRRRRFVLHRAGGVTADTDALSREDQAGSAVDALRGVPTCSKCSCLSGKDAQRKYLQV